MNRFSEKDWKLFRSKLSDWQEAYMDRLNREYIKLLSGKGNASDKFWALEKRIREDKQDCGVQCEMSRSCVYSHFPRPYQASKALPFRNQPSARKLQ